jgi:hypothetical protein
LLPLTSKKGLKATDVEIIVKTLHHRFKNVHGNAGNGMILAPPPPFEALNHVDFEIIAPFTVTWGS